MYKVLCIDEEKNQVNKIVKMIVDSGLDFTVLKTVSTRKEALDFLEKNQLDLIVSDIRLPDYNGYQLFKDLKESHPEIKMILYTSYNEYEYVQKALEEGLIDYIFKPVKEQELRRSLIRAKQLLDDISRRYEEQNRILAKFDESLPILQDRFLTNLIHGYPEKESDIHKTFEYFNIMIPPGYTVMVLKIDYYDKLSLIMEEKDKHMLIFSALYKIESILEEYKNGIAFINRHDEIVIILGGKLSINESITIGEKIRKSIETDLKITSTIGIGKMYNEARKINISYKQAKAAIRYNYYLGFNSVIHINYVEPTNIITYEYPLKKEEYLVYETVIGNEKRVLELLEDLFAVLKACQPLPDKLLPKIILDIIVSINRYASEQGINIDSFFSENFSMKDVLKHKEHNDAFNYLSNLLPAICKYIKEKRKKNEEAILVKAKMYVEENFLSNITLNQTAMHVQTTPENLSVILAEAGYRSFYEYCTKIRIEKAKSLLEETNLSDEGIALKIGYEDRNYFRKIFEQMEGMTTDEYRLLKK